MSRVQYRFALDADGRLVDVKELARERGRHTFACVACGARLVAHLKDDLRARHFAHYRVDECSSYESYLHRAAKRAFLQTFRECVEAGRPFMLRIPVVDRCVALEEALGITCGFPRYREIDLTHWFNSAGLEQRHGDFVADILLSGPRPSNPLLVEVAVTHKCEEAKIASGERILELDVASDVDIAELRTAIITVGGDGRHRAHNFRTKVLLGQFCAGECPKPAGVFVIHTSGRPKLFPVTAGAAVKFKPPSAAWRKILVEFEDAPPTVGIEQLNYVGTDLPPGDSLFQRAAVAAIRDGVAVRSCEVCRRQGSPSIFGRVWCFAYREEVHPSRAAQCTEF